MSPVDGTAVASHYGRPIVNDIPRSVAAGSVELRAHAYGLAARLCLIIQSASPGVA